MACGWTALPFARLSCHPDGAWRGGFNGTMPCDILQKVIQPAPPSISPVLAGTLFFPCKRLLFLSPVPAGSWSAIIMNIRGVLLYIQNKVSAVKLFAEGRKGARMRAMLFGYYSLASIMPKQWAVIDCSDSKYLAPRPDNLYDCEYLMCGMFYRFV